MFLLYITNYVYILNLRINYVYILNLRIQSNYTKATYFVSVLRFSAIYLFGYDGVKKVCFTVFWNSKVNLIWQLIWVLENMGSKKSLLVFYAKHMAYNAKYRCRRKQFNFLLIKLWRTIDTTQCTAKRKEILNDWLWAKLVWQALE